MQTLKLYQIRWTTGRKVESDRLRAASAADARQAFQAVPGVRVLSVEQVASPAKDAGPSPAPALPGGPLASAAHLPAV